MTDYKIKGTKLPLEKLKANLVSTVKGGAGNEGNYPFNEETPRISYGSKVINGEVYILFDNVTYSGDNYYIIKELLLIDMEEKKKYTIDEIINGKFILNLNEEQHKKLSGLGVDLATYANNGQFSTWGTWVLRPNEDGVVSSLWKRGTFIKFEDIDFEKELLGYECPVDLYNGKVPKESLFIKCESESNEYVFNVPGDSFFMPGEVVETWKPIYKKSEVEIELGSPVRKCTITKDCIIVTSGGGTNYKISYAALKVLRDKFEIQFEHWIGKFNSIQIGCSEGASITVEDINKILELRNTL